MENYKEIECFNCVFFDHTSTNLEVGLCRRYPPKISSSTFLNRNTVGRLPRVFSNEYCGEYKVNQRSNNVRNSNKNAVN
jgi:hypothetical protein